MLFYFNCSGDHQDLHSFPTRRSSDLSDGMPAPGAAPTRPLTVPPTVTPAAAGALPGRVSQNVTIERSEEHTSELQSRFDLVCRLLLEKKKYRSRHPANPTATPGPTLC